MSEDPRYEDYHSVLNSLVGVLFLGTPHDGSRFAVIGESWAAFWSRFGYGTNSELLTMLKPLAVGSTDSILRDLDGDFRTIQNRGHPDHLVAYYFWETKSAQFRVSAK
jgi:hypothetical protein